MGYFKKFRTAYYGGNYGNEYSKSRRASEAEDNGRFPRTRAAKHLSVSVEAFDSGCYNCGYRPTEWHHVGKYATMVDYYDTNELNSNQKFWEGCGEHYKTKIKKLWCLYKASRLVECRSLVLIGRERLDIQS